jgi:prepilin-type N-terminal cleavage/methylation domain-containing protein
MGTQRVAGFTIVELLVVISIIAVLAAILVPVFLSINKSQRQTSCVNNLREIGVAVALYREDYGVYPPAPLPAYLRSGGIDLAIMPMVKQHDSAVTKWQEASFTPKLYLLAEEALVGATSVRVDVTPDTTAFPQDAFILLNDPEAGVSEIAIVQGVSGGRVTLAAPLQNAYPVGSYADTRYENFGLYGLYYQYFSLDKRDYVKAHALFHCPALEATASVDRDANTAAENATTPIPRKDPLMAGFNTYDIAYNYDQYSAEIFTFDQCLGTPGLNSSRMLRNPQAPADTVITWCYAHRGTPAVTYVPPDPTAPALTVTAGDPTEGRQVLNVERNRRDERDLVLLLDGTVDIVNPELLTGKPDAGQHKYYWVPPFLHVAGEVRQ